MEKRIKVVSIDMENEEFITDDGNIYPILFDIYEGITIEGFQKALDDSKEIILNLIKGDE